MGGGGWGVGGWGTLLVSLTTSTVIGVFEWPGGRGWEVDVGGWGVGGGGRGYVLGLVDHLHVGGRCDWGV